MFKAIVFDMDGTIADLYGVPNWLPKLRSEDATPYADAKPMFDMDTLNVILNEFQLLGWKIIITSWLAMGATKEYDNAVRSAKKEWLEKFDFPYDEIHLVKYGTTKANCTRKHGGYQVLVDDNEKIRDGWTLGEAINPTDDLIAKLLELLESETE